MDVVVGVVLPAFNSSPSVTQLLGTPAPSAQRLVSGKVSSSLRLCGGAHVAGRHGFQRRGLFVRYATGNQSRNNTVNGSSSGEMRDYYDVLGVSVNASPEAIRKAYRALQKIHHPDVAGSESHIWYHRKALGEEADARALIRDIWSYDAKVIEIQSFYEFKKIRKSLFLLFWLWQQHKGTLVPPLKRGCLFVLFILFVKLRSPGPYGRRPRAWYR